MTSFGSELQAHIGRMINNSMFANDAWIISRNITTGGSFGYAGPTLGGTLGGTIPVISANYIHTRLGLRDYGDLREGESRIVIRPSDTVDADDLIVYQGGSYNVREIKQILHDGVKIAQVVTLSKQL